ncbi:MAG TPA: VCBS repeat-containing protein, partial [Gammaproteobacteria bacterium]|nr:VCBS repeat-containing protein [Gammaproteobacteria bacterium]
MIKNYTFSHSTTSGDINCDGFIDIYTGNALLIGDGTGRFTHQSQHLPEGKYKNQKVNAFSSTIADFNGDGCGDVVMHIYRKKTNVWMSNHGKHLPRTFQELKIENYYGEDNQYLNYMTSGDLDGDGDPDLVAAITRLFPYYEGRKILIFINEKGELIEKTKTLIQDERDQDVEGRPQNHGEGTIRLVDHDRDGDLDIIDSTGGSFEENGRFGYTIFENDGTGHFTVIPESEFVILREEMFEGYSFNGPQTSTAYPIDIDGIGRLDYVTFIRSPWSRATSSVYGYTVLGRDKPIDIEELVAAEKAKIKALKKAKEHTLFDGRYSFTISRYHDDEDWNELGSGFIQIKNGIMTVAKEGRTLDTGSIDLYDSFAGQIDKEGNIMSSLKISALFGVDSTPSGDLNGNIDSQLQGKWDHYYDVIIQIKPINEPAKSDEKVITTAEPAELFTTIETSNAFDGRYSFDLFRYSDDEGDRKVGSGFVDINNGEVIIDKDNSDLKTGS